MACHGGGGGEDVRRQWECCEIADRVFVVVAEGRAGEAERVNKLVSGYFEYF
jgi:hypothetical protein